MKNSNSKMYLSEYMKKNIDISKLGNKTCIISGVGSGKNKWVEKELTKHGNVLLITSRKAKKDETVLDSIFEGKLDKNKLDNYIVYTNSGIETFIKNGSYDSLCNYFDYIVVDEAHSLITDSTFADSPFHLWAFIKKITDSKKVILMTGTVFPIIELLQEHDWDIIDCMNECKNIKPPRIVIDSKESILKFIESKSNTDEKMIYMANSAKDIVDNLYDEIEDKCKIKKENIAFSMSDEKVIKYKLEKEMPQEYKRLTDTYDSIINAKKLPNDIKLLLTTSRLKEGINLKDGNIKYLFCESHFAADLVQLSGRVRKGIDTLYVVYDAFQNNNNSLLEIDYFSVSI